MRTEALNEFSNRVKERPAYLDSMRSSSAKSAKLAKIANVLKVIDPTQCLTYTEEEFKQEYGKNGKAIIRHYLKNEGLKPRIVNDSGKVHIWCTKV